MSTLEVDKIIPQSGTATQLGESGDTITIPAGATITNNGTATGFGSADTEKVKVSANDTTAGFLNGKLVGGTNITLTEGTDGGNETLTAALSTTVTNFTSTGIDDNANATAITIDDKENIAIGITPSDFSTAYSSKALQVTDVTSLFSMAVSTGDRRTILGNNLFIGTDNNRKFVTAGAQQSFLQQAEGSLSFHATSSTGSAGGNSSTTERFRFDSNGLKFNGDTAAANALDDYEEGTWSPAINGSTITTGYYTKVGRMCVATFGDATSNVPELTNGSNFLITGLPFSQLGSGWTYGSTPTVSYADASASYHSFPLTGRQRNDGNIHVVNRSGQTKVAGDPVNLCIVYQTN